MNNCSLDDIIIKTVCQKKEGDICFEMKRNAY